MKRTKWIFFAVFFFALAITNCEREEEQINTFDGLELVEIYADQMKTANAGKEISSPSYNFFGKGTLYVSEGYRKIQGEAHKYTKLRYNGTKADRLDTELYFGLGISEKVLPSAMNVELIFLHDQLIIKDVSSTQIYVFEVEELDSQLLKSDKTLRTEVSYIGAFMHDPDDLSKSERGCECFCTARIHENAPNSCDCISQSCGDYCSVRCRRSDNQANCPNTCAEQ